MNNMPLPIDIDVKYSAKITKAEFMDWTKVVTNGAATIASCLRMCAWLDERLTRSDYDYIMHLDIAAATKYYTFYIKDANVAMLFKLTWA
jgi:hypothetical protein